MSESFAKLVSLINKKNPLQKKALASFLKGNDSLFWQRADEFASKMLSLCKKQGITAEYVVNAYLKMCHDMLTEQIKFKKTGCYSVPNAAEAYANCYSSEKEMSSYMYGLALSQFLWPNHYAMYDFFINQSCNLRKVESYLEIGPGHGLYLLEALKLLPNAKFLAVDISPVSKKISQATVEHFAPDAECQFLVRDVNDFHEGKFDYIVMCEVLEHLDRPLETMKDIRDLLNGDGYFFMTTCANCPAIDHVYLYNSVKHIRDQIHEAGFKVVTDLPLAVNASPEEDWDDQKVEVNYAAMLQKR